MALAQRVDVEERKGPVALEELERGDFSYNLLLILCFISERFEDITEKMLVVVI